MIDRLARGRFSMPSASRDRTIRRFSVPQKGVVRALDVRLQLSFIIAVVALAWIVFGQAAGVVTATPPLLAALAAAGRSSVRYLHIHRP
jgi:hypothetical protein